MNGPNGSAPKYTNSNMEEIIAPVEKALILAELTPDKLQRKTNHYDNSAIAVVPPSAFVP